MRVPSGAPFVRSVVATAIPALFGTLACHSATSFDSARPPVLSSTPSSVGPGRFFSPPLALATPEDAVVRVVGPETLCSGTLVDDDLVLTAHHCVVMRDERGDFTTVALPPTALRVEVGGDDLPWGSIAVSRIVTSPGGEGGGEGDVAIIVLSRKLTGITPYQPRLGSPPYDQEPVDPIGFGRCATSAGGIHREVRLGGNIDRVARGAFFMSAALCPGDSGGPAVARGSHQVIGVVSQSAMDGDSMTRGHSVMARIDTFRNMFSCARQAADNGENAGPSSSACPY